MSYTQPQSRARAAKEYLFALSTPVSMTLAGLLATVLPRRRSRSERPRKQV
jgi:hypothetical protein